MFKRLLGLVAIYGVLVSNTVSADPPAEVLPINGYNLEYIDVGSGQLIVGVHGAISDYRVWLPYAEKLGDEFRFVGYSRRYYGTQPWPKEPAEYSHDAHAEDLASFVQHLDVGAVHLLARSSGAHTAIVMAKQYPELVRSLVFWEPVIGEEIIDGYDEHQQAASDWGAKWGGVSAAEKAGKLQLAAKLMIETVYELPSGGFDRLPELTRKVVLDNSRTIPILFDQVKIAKTDCEYTSTINKPTLIIKGTETHKGLSREFDRLNDCLPDSSIALISGVTHQGAMTHVSEISDVIRTWIKNLP